MRITIVYCGKGINIILDFKLSSCSVCCMCSETSAYKIQTPGNSHKKAYNFLSYLCPYTSPYYPKITPHTNNSPAPLMYVIRLWRVQIRNSENSNNHIFSAFPFLTDFEPFHNLNPYRTQRNVKQCVGMFIPEPHSSLKSQRYVGRRL